MALTAGCFHPGAIGWMGGGGGGGGGLGGGVGPYSAALGQQQSGLNQPAPLTMMARHAQDIHAAASNLQKLNERIMAAVDRLIGLAPEIGNANGTSGESPDTDAVLLVAQFGMERMRQGIERLEAIASRLESVV